MVVVLPSLYVRRNINAFAPLVGLKYYCYLCLPGVGVILIAYGLRGEAFSLYSVVVDFITYFVIIFNQAHCEIMLKGLFQSV